MTDADLSRALALLDAKPQGDGSWRAWCPVHQPDGDRGKRNLVVLPPDHDAFPTFSCDRDCAWPELRRELLARGVSRSLLRGAGREPAGVADGSEDLRVPLPDKDRLQGWTANLLDDGTGWDEDRLPFLDYLQRECGLSDEQIRAEGIGLSNGITEPALRFRLCLTVPYRDAAGDTVGLRLLNPLHLDPTRRKWWLSGHGGKHLLGAHKVASWPADELVLFCEGESDYFASTALGLHAVAAPGASVVPEDLSVLAGRRLVVCYDNDPTGRERAGKLAEALAAAGAEPFVADIGQHLRHKGADVRDWLLHSELTAQQFREFIATAAPWKKADAELQRLTAAELLRREARRTADAHEATALWEPPPSFETAAEELAEPDEPVTWTVTDLHPTGLNAILIAGFKVGKTTLALNLVRSLVDGAAFLDSYKTALPPEGRVAWWNYELDTRQARRWMRSLVLERPERLWHLPMRGYSLPFTSPAGMNWAVAELTRRKVRALVIDPFGAAYDGEENDNAAVRDWLRALDELKRRAGVEDVFLVVHTGRAEQIEGKERGRGATRLDDWADVRWTYVECDDKSGPRFFRAHGRDVDEGPFPVHYVHDNRWLYRDGDQIIGRSQATRGRLVEQAVELVAGRPGINSTELRLALGAGNTECTVAVRSAEVAGRIRWEPGKRGAKHYYVAEEPTDPADPAEPRRPSNRRAPESPPTATALGARRATRARTDRPSTTR